MNIGTLIAKYLRSEIPPSEPEIQVLERILNELQRNNFAAINWPTAGVVNYDEISGFDIDFWIIRHRITRDGRRRTTRDGNPRVSRGRISFT
jgi:hypothetical protein